MSIKINVNKFYGEEDFDILIRYIIREKLRNYIRNKERCYNSCNIKATNYQTKEKIE